MKCNRPSQPGRETVYSRCGLIYLMEKKMIVDSKVSLTAYEKYINEEDDELKKA
jgi:DNA anti-recombination protein RmuC